MKRREEEKEKKREQNTSRRSELYISKTIRGENSSGEP